MNERAIASSVADAILAYMGSRVTDPEIIKALEQEGFKLFRGFYVKRFNPHPSKDPEFESEMRAEQAGDGKLFFRVRYVETSSGPRRGWFGMLKEFYPNSLLRFAARGFQIRRKDKDTMSDTGGVSKSREREPHQKPPRDDVKERYRTKDKPAPERERDTDTDTDTSRDTDTKGDKDTKIRESRFAAIEERLCDKNLIFSSDGRRRVGGNATVANGLLSRFPKTFGALLQKSG